MLKFRRFQLLKKNDYKLVAEGVQFSIDDRVVLNWVTGQLNIYENMKTVVNYHQFELHWLDESKDPRQSELFQGVGNAS